MFSLINELSNYRKNTIQIELTDVCNLQCPACNQGMGTSHVHDIKPGFMHPGLFRKIMDDLISSRMRFFEVQLFWFGESLLHADFEHIFSLLMLLMEQKRLFAQIDLHTNGLLLNDRIIDLLCFANIKLPMLTFSIDAITPETYSKIRKGGQYDVLIKNIHKFISKRESLGQLLPAIRAQFLLQESNREELMDFIKYWKNFFNNYSRKNVIYRHVKNYFLKEDYRIKYPHIDKKKSKYPDDVFDITHPIYPHEKWMLELKKVGEIFKDTIWIKRTNFKPESRQKEINAIFDEEMKKNGIINEDEENYRLVMDKDNVFPDYSLQYFGRKPCAAPFFKPVIRWDGMLNMCCNDPHGIMALGSLTEHTFDELWFSEKAWNVRKSMIKGDFDSLKICRDCSNIDGINISDEEIKQFFDKYS